MNNHHVPVVFCSDRNVIAGLLVAVTSALENLNQNYHLKCYILSVNLEEEEKKFISNSLTTVSKRLKLKFIDIANELLKDLYTYERFTPAVYGRYFAAKLIPEEDFLIYIDADIIVQKDLSLLVSEVKPENMAAAVPEGIIEDFISDELIQLFNLDRKKPYVNTGFLLINAEFWRQHRVVHQLLDMAQKIGSKARLVDQDVFNITFGQNDLSYLDVSWNTFVFLNPYKPVEILSRDINIHTVVEFKPWMFKSTRSRGVVREFYRYLKQTSVPWKDCPNSTIQYQNIFDRIYKKIFTKRI